MSTYVTSGKDASKPKTSDDKLLERAKKREAIQAYWRGVEDSKGSVRDRILAHVEMLPDSPGCWLWTAGTCSGGYSELRVRGKMLRVHRLSYETFKGHIPDGLTIDHLCRVRTCVNPEHLEAVPQKVNALRGVGACAKHAKKTHCPQGHLLDGTKLDKRGRVGRFCRTCNKAWARGWRVNG